MRILILAGAALVSACGGGNEAETTEANAMIADNMMMDDLNMSMDPMADPGVNAALDANTQNLMIQDATTNDADTNLANGL